MLDHVAAIELHPVETMPEWLTVTVMARLLEISHAVKGRDRGPSIQEALYHFSLAAGEDLAPWYRELGITYDPPPPISPEELRRCLEASTPRPAEP